MGNDTDFTEFSGQFRLVARLFSVHDVDTVLNEIDL
jgi:hypothetical protein